MNNLPPHPRNASKVQRNRVIEVATLTTLFLLGPLTAASSAEDGPALGVRGEAVDNEGALDVGIEVIDVEEVISTGSSEPSPYVWIAVPHVGFSGDLDDGNQGTCRDVRWDRVLREQADEARAQAERDYLFNFDYIPEHLGQDPTVACPTDPVDALPAELVETHIRAVLEEQLDRPEPHMPPGFALTGLRMYLITDHELTFDAPEVELDLDITTLQVQVTATGTSTVDWGDGTVTTHDTGASHGYPDGPIDHVYTDAATVDITVTDTWDVTWDAGILAGGFEAPLAPVVLEGVEVQERRAVRTR